MSTPIFLAPVVDAAAGITGAGTAVGKAYTGLNPAEVLIRFKQFGIHAAIVFVVVFLYGCISASLITFFHPGLVAEGKDENEKAAAAFNKKTKIFERLDLLFPDDLEFSPYGFDVTRGLVDTAKKTADAEDRAKEAAKNKADKAYEVNAEKEHYTRFLGWLVKALEIGGPFFENPAEKPKSSSLPYSWLDVVLVDGKIKDGIQCKQTKIDNESDVRVQSEAAGGLFKLAAIWSKEIIGSALYFSYGRGRYYLKQFFGFIQLWMKKSTPIKNAIDDRPDYTYITNIACLLSIIILAILIFFMLFWPGVSLIVGIVKNVYTKTGKAGIIDNDFFDHVFGFIPTKVVVFFGLSFVLFLIGAVNYMWQPIQLFGTILFYPISYSVDEWFKVLSEIIPTLMGVFVVTMIIVSMYDLDQPIAIPISIIMAITYVVIFKDKFAALGAFISKIDTKMLGFHYDAETEDTMKKNKLAAPVPDPVPAPPQPTTPYIARGKLHNPTLPTRHRSPIPT